MKFLTIKKQLQYSIPITLTLFSFVTIIRNVLTDGGYDKLYGFPFAYISNSYANSFHYDVYVLPFIFDLLFYWLAITIVIIIFEKRLFILKTHWTVITISTIVSLFWIYLHISTTLESIFYFTNNIDYKTTNIEFFIGSHP